MKVEIDIMKKRILSVLLLVCMLIPMHEGLAPEAFAAKDYSPYIEQVEIAKGDTVYSIITSRGMNYTEVEKAVLIANGFSSADNLGAVKPGQKLYIPKSAADAKAIVTLYNTVVSAEIPAASVVSYTVKSGDSMSSICSSMKLTYGVCKSAIMSLNGWKDESKLSRIYVGQTIKFPASDDAAKAIKATISTAQETNMNISSNSVDTFEYYLVKHSMAKGETIKSVCKAYGVTYTAALGEKIKNLNGLKDQSKVLAGYSYLFPSAASDGAEYAVYSHKIVAGDTVNNLCNSYGAKYGEVSDKLAALNPKINLGSIKTGQTILLLAPVSSTETPIVIK